MKLVINRHTDGTVTVHHDGPEPVELVMRQYGREHTTVISPGIRTYVPVRLAPTADDHPTGPAD